MSAEAYRFGPGPMSPFESDLGKGKAFYRNVPGLLEGDLGWLRPERDKLYLEAQEKLPLKRLRGVSALGFLTVVSFDPEEMRFTGFSHSREFHSVLVARLTEQILTKNNFSEQEVRAGILAGLLHDAAMPAGGDAIKSVDPRNLDEETHLTDVLDDKARRFIDEQGVSMDQMSGAVKNEGIVGKVLDVADRLAYTYADSHFLYGPALGDKSPFPYKQIRVDRETEQISFDDPYALHNFLYARALNHYQVYLHPVNRAGDLVIRRLVDPLYAADGTKPLSPQVLRSATDAELLTVVADHYGLSEESLREDLINIAPKVEACLDEGEVHEWSNYVGRATDLVPLGVDKVPRFNPCTNYLVSGTVPMPYEELEPDNADVIKALVHASAPPYALYYYDASERTRLNDIIRGIGS